MAAARIDTVEQVITCPVCFEHYRDPRSLTCGHQFCLECIQKLQHVRPGGQAEITCPTCRGVTLVPVSTGIKNLPRLLIANELQLFANNIIKSRENKSQVFCNNCDGIEFKARLYCFDCHNNMCDNCYGVHAKGREFVNHRISPISPHIFCTTHREEITMYCKACLRGICNRCAITGHKDHKKDIIAAQASICRNQLSNVLKHGTSTENNVQNLRVKVENVEAQRASALAKLDSVQTLLIALEDKIKKAKSNITVGTSVDYEALKSHHQRLEEFMSVKASLTEETQYLTKKVSDQELVARTAEIPTFLLQEPVQVVTGGPQLAAERNMLKELQMIGTELRHLYEGYDPTVSAHNHDDKKAESTYTFTVNIPTGAYTYITGIVFNQDGITVRTNKSYRPIKVYDPDSGSLRHEYGDNINGLESYSFIDTLSYDIKRDLYLATHKSELIRFSNKGHTHHRIDTKCNNALTAVHYMETRDLYLIHESSKTIHIMDPDTKSMVGTVGSADLGIYVYLSSYTNRFGSQVIVASDYFTTRLQLYDMDGALLHAYEQGQLKYPCGVTAYKSERILVCDYDNKRLMSYWREENKDRWECILDEDELGGHPELLTVDRLGNIAVSVWKQDQTYHICIYHPHAPTSTTPTSTTPTSPTPTSPTPTSTAPTSTTCVLQ